MTGVPRETPAADLSGGLSPARVGDRTRGGLIGVELAEGTRVVGDLHLDVGCPISVEGFCAWLGSLGDCPRLIVLGDLFEYWVGMAQAAHGGGAQVLAAMGRLVEGGCALELLLGNRDFLMDERLARATGARIHPDGLLGTLPDGGGVLFLHGDELCTLDRAYQRLRRVLRSRPVTWLAPRLPGALTRFAARRLRRASRRALATKPLPAKSQVPEAAAAQLLGHSVGVLVVGHAHRFRDEALKGAGRWLVLDAFGGPRDQLRVAADGRLSVESSGAAYRPPAETLEKDRPPGSQSDPSG